MLQLQVRGEAALTLEVEPVDHAHVSVPAVLGQPRPHGVGRAVRRWHNGSIGRSAQRTVLHPRRIAVALAYVLLRHARLKHDPIAVGSPYWRRRAELKRRGPPGRTT